MRAYTPGPWRLVRFRHAFVVDASPESVCVVEPPPGLEVMREPDARLIAAAPDLAEALLDALYWARHPPGCSTQGAVVGSCDCYIARAAAALRKANVE